MPSWSRIARRIRVPLGFVFAAAYLWLAQPTWRSIGLCALIVAPGLWVRALAAGHVRKNAEITQTGPYAYTRNPLYLGSILIAIGFAVGSRSLWVAAALAMMFAAIYIPVIRSEEAYLRSNFPGFDDYARRVPRLVPRFHAVGESVAPMTFSRELYLKHREYNALIGALAMLAALMAKLIL